MAHSTWGIILACCKELQFTSDVDTAFLTLGNRPVISYSLKSYEDCPDIDGVVVVVRKERLESLAAMVRMFGFAKVRKVVAGTNQYQSSVSKGLEVLEDEASIVSIHDASRPCISAGLISETIKAAKRYGSAVAASKVNDVVKEVEKGHKISKSLDNSKLWMLQSPQTYKVEVLAQAIKNPDAKKTAFGDHASVMEQFNQEVHLVPAPSSNIRISSPAELTMAATLVEDLV